MKTLVYALLFTIPVLFYGNECDCKSNFEWAKTTFENNDAGFEYAISLKGKSAYESHTEAIAKKASTTSDIRRCEKLVRE
ncbi:MAG: peptidase S41, partial [Bacteroidota bacterium]